ncbi:MAG: hypothetical protein RLO51_16850 [Thalassobaculum sp.]|uniref:hypothetical protein n=1 Tax=Thalassobaculum sp. TaxID=2022740 RepID=UPI0032EB3F61
MTGTIAERNRVVGRLKRIGNEIAEAMARREFPADAPYAEAYDLAARLYRAYARDLLGDAVALPTVDHARAALQRARLAETRHMQFVRAALQAAVRGDVARAFEPRACPKFCRELHRRFYAGERDRNETDRVLRSAMIIVLTAASDAAEDHDPAAANTVTVDIPGMEFLATGAPT